MVRRLLLIDDEPAISRVLEPVLRAAGWEVITAATGAAGLRAAKAEAVDIVLLDLGLPDTDGKEIIPMLIAEGRIAIIVISARHQEDEKVAALNAGADDYVDKPFSIDELLARIRVAERRLTKSGRDQQQLQAGCLRLNVANRLVTLEGEPIRLSPKEFDLLRELIIHAGQVVTHRRLLFAGWGNPSADQQYLRSYIALLRQKLERDPAEPEIIRSESGVGYRLVPIGSDALEPPASR